MPTMTAAERAAAPVPVGRDPAFRRLLRASSVSMLGSHVTSIAYPLLVLRLTGSPLEAGWVAFGAIAPSLLVYVPAGALVDRWDPRRAMLVSEVGRGVAIAMVAIMLVMDKPNVPLLTAAAVVEGVLGVFSTLAERRCVGSIVRPGQVSSALVRLEGRNHVVLLVGRPLGGLLFGIEPILPFLVDVATFIYSVAALAAIKSRWPAVAGGTEVSYESASGNRLSSDIRNGLRRLCEDRFACVVIMAFSAGTLIFQALIMLFLADAHAQKLSALAIGIVLAASGIGGALGSAAASWLLSRVRYSWIKLQTLIWFLGFAVLALLTGPQVILMATVMAILGFTGATGNIALDTHLMRNFDKDMLARVTSMSRLLSLIACAIGPAVGGIIVQVFGITGAMTLLFLVTSVLPLLAVIAPAAAGARSHSPDRQEMMAVPDAPVPVGQS
jgi:MFS family permease